MKLDARSEGMCQYIPTRYPNGLPDSIPARVYTRVVAGEALRMADQALHLVRQKLREKNG